MEPITGLFLGFLLLVNFGQEAKIDNLNEQISYLQTETAMLNLDFLKLATAHSAAVASLKTVDQQHERTMDTLKGAIDYNLTIQETHTHEE